MFMMVWHGYKHSLLGYTYNVFDFKVEGTWVKAEGNQGYFLQRMTPGWATSNGRFRYLVGWSF